MSHVHDTWYVLEDGRKAAPSDVVTDDKGVLRHSSGRAVKIRDSGVPLTSGNGEPVAATIEMKPGDAVPLRDKPVAKDREMKAADDGKGYRTRSTTEGAKR